MSVFREVTLEYKGKEYTLTPSNKLLRKIEGDGEISLAHTVARLGTGKPPVSEIAYIVTMLLSAAGVPNADEDEIYGELMNDCLTNEGKQFAAMSGKIVEIISPPSDLAKKSGPQSDTKGN